MDKEVNNMINAIQHMRSKEMLEVENIIFDGLGDPATFDIARIPEPAFVTYFLPYFCLEKDFEDGNNMLSKWKVIAGSFMNEVAICDERGVELFRTPAIFSTSTIRKSGFGEGDSIKQIVDMSFAEGNNNQGAAQANMVRRLMSRNNFDSTQLDATSDEARWNAIFVRYGKKPIGQTADLAQNTTTSKVDIIQFDYD